LGIKRARVRRCLFPAVIEWPLQHIGELIVAGSADGIAANE
jgi:hypothetical protein